MVKPNQYSKSNIAQIQLTSEGQILKIPVFIFIYLH